MATLTPAGLMVPVGDRTTFCAVSVTMPDGTITVPLCEMLAALKSNSPPRPIAGNELAVPPAFKARVPEGALAPLCAALMDGAPLAGLKSAGLTSAGFTKAKPAAEGIAATV